MKIMNQYPGIHLADVNDKATVLKILTEAFISDPHMSWLIERSKNKNKLNIIFEYVIDETLSKGRIYLTDNNQGAALWQSREKEKFSFSFIKRNLSFLYKLGISTVARNLGFVKVSHSHFPPDQKFYYLLAIGVLPEGRGKGLASKLMDPVLENCRANKIPVFLETANPANVEIYKKKGFVLTDSMKNEKLTINFMKFE
jgi:ribosomal protein S18 acetylase RimI-like enzyme